jgi:hypothetical protein
MVILYSTIAAVLMGFHIFSLKLMSVYKNYFYHLATFIIVSFALTRYLIYIAMENTSNPTIVHMILNCSVFITFLLSIFVLKVKDFNYGLFTLGLVLFVCGIACIQQSYKTVKP